MLMPCTKWFSNHCHTFCHCKCVLSGCVWSSSATDCQCRNWPKFENYHFQQWPQIPLHLTTAGPNVMKLCAKQSKYWGGRKGSPNAHLYQPKSHLLIIVHGTELEHFRLNSAMLGFWMLFFTWFISLPLINNKRTKLANKMYALLQPLIANGI